MLRTKVNKGKKKGWKRVHPGPTIKNPAALGGGFHEGLATSAGHRACQLC